MAAVASSAPLLVPSLSTCIYEGPLEHHNFTIEPAYYSQYFDLPTATVIDPFQNNNSVTIAPGPTTFVTSSILTHHEGNVETLPAYTIDASGQTVLISNPQPGQTVIVIVSIESTSSSTTTSTSSSTATTTTPSTTSSDISLISFSDSTMTVPPTTSPISYATTCTISSVATPAQTDIVNAINQWQLDIGQVNRFLEQAIDFQVFTLFNDMRTAAEIAYGVAVDEPCQFETLQNALNTLPENSTAYARYQCAKNDLASVFGPQVLGNLLDLITSPPNFPFDLSAINVFRCCNVLPDVQILFNLTQQINPGASPQAANLMVPIPDTCLPGICAKFPRASTCT